MTKIGFSVKCHAMPDRKARIAGAFDRAEAYDLHAHVQRKTARRLAQRIAALPLDPRLPALEIGCGTGFLTAALLDARPDLRLTATDIAPAMLDRARATLGDRPDLAFALMDGEAPGPAPEGGWGLIASNLAIQWFEKPSEALARLVDRLAPGGCLAFTTLVAGSFAEWQEALGIDGIVRDWPDADNWAAFCPSECRISIDCHDLVEHHEDGRAFLRALKAIGAATPWARAATPAEVRRAIASFEAGGARITYRIAEILIEKPEGL